MNNNFVLNTLKPGAKKSSTHQVSYFASSQTYSNVKDLKETTPFAESGCSPGLKA